MKKILTLAVLLLTLLPVVEVAALSYGNESYGSNTSCTSQSTGIWCRAQTSNADIYTEVYDEDIYDFNDFSDYGDFSQEVVFQDGSRYYYNYGGSGGSSSNTCDNYDISDVYYGCYGSNVIYGNEQGGNKTTNNDEVIGRGARYWEDANNLVTLFGLKYASSATTVKYLPKELNSL